MNSNLVAIYVLVQNRLQYQRKGRSSVSLSMIPFFLVKIWVGATASAKGIWWSCQTPAVIGKLCTCSETMDWSHRSMEGNFSMSIYPLAGPFCGFRIQYAWFSNGVNFSAWASTFETLVFPMSRMTKNIRCSLSRRSGLYLNIFSRALGIFDRGQAVVHQYLSHPTIGWDYYHLGYHPLAAPITRPGSKSRLASPTAAPISFGFLIDICRFGCYILRENAETWSFSSDFLLQPSINSSFESNRARKLQPYPWRWGVACSLDAAFPATQDTTDQNRGSLFNSPPHGTENVPRCQGPHES